MRIEARALEIRDAGREGAQARESARTLELELSAYRPAICRATLARGAATLKRSNRM
jgi:hypothetical protein